MSDIACWDGWLLGRTYICLMVHNNIKGAKEAFLGGITERDGSRRKCGGRGCPHWAMGEECGGCGVWGRAVSFTVSLSRGVSFAPEYAHRFFGRIVMLPPL